MSAPNETIEIEVPKSLHTELEALSKQEGRPFKDLVAEALYQLIASKAAGQPRPAVMAAYQASHDRFGPLYQKLAK